MENVKWYNYGKTGKEKAILWAILLWICFAFLIFANFASYFDANQHKGVLLAKEAPPAPSNPAIERIANYIHKQNISIPSSVRKEIAETIIKESAQAKIPAELLMGIIEIESCFNPCKVSPKGARGLMQILVDNCFEGKIDKDKIHDIDYNIKTGICVLKEHLILNEGDLNKALYGYVGKDREYAGDVYRAMGQFFLFDSVV